MHLQLAKILVIFYGRESLQLIDWKPGQTIHPALKECILSVKAFIEKTADNIDDFLKKENQYDNKHKMVCLIKHNRFFLLKKTTWNYIEHRISDTRFINTVLKILLINAESRNVNRLCLTLLTNIDLLEEFILCWR